MFADPSSYLLVKFGLVELLWRTKLFGPSHYHAKNRMLVVKGGCSGKMR